MPFADPNDIMSTNPYLSLPQVEKPHWSSTLGTMLANVGAGISSANASGMPWHAGIAPGAALATNALARSQKEQEAEAMRRFQMGIALQGLNDKRTEAARKQQGAQSWADANDPSKAPGFNLTPSPIDMAPRADLKTAGAPLVDYLTQKHGLSPIAAASVIGGLGWESPGFNTNQVHDGGRGYGLAGWDPQRTAGLKAFAEKQGKPFSDTQTQLDYVVNEMKGGDMGAQRAYAMLQGAKTPEDATTAMMHFFRPAGYTPADPNAGHGYQGRVANARALVPGSGVVAGGPQTHDGLPARQNADGSHSSELSITITNPRINDGRPTNIPSLWGGRQLDEEGAVGAALRSGRAFPAFPSIDTAVASARARSNAGGAAAVPLPPQGGGDRDVMTSPTPAPGTPRTPPPMREPPPEPPQVPKPMLPREDAAYLANAVRTGAMTPKEAEAEKLRIVGDLHKDKKEQARASWQMQWDNYKNNRGELNKTDAWQTMSETEARERLGNAYDPSKAYQVNKTGEVKPIGGAQTVVNIDQKGDSEFAKKMGAMDAERFGKIFEAETSMNEMASKLGYAMDQFRQTYTGPGAETANYLNKILGAAGFKEAGEKANAADAAMAAISQMKPFMRAPGSGASSDRDMDMYARALPSLLNLPGGNERVVAYFQRMADRATRVRELAQEHSEGGKIPLTRTGFDDAVKKIGPLFTEDERKELTALAKGKPSAAPADPKKVDAIREKYGLMSVPEGGVPAPQATPQPVDVLKQKYGLQ